MHQLIVVVGNTCEPLLLWLQKEFGGYIGHRKGRNRPMFHWSVRADAAVKFLLAIQPYVHMKADQVRLAIEFQSSRVNQSGTLSRDGLGRITAKRISEEELQKRDYFRQAISEANQGGATWLQ